jgi:hypothetical protein
VERLVVKLVLACALLASCSYHASFGDCTVVCRAPTECPDGFACGAEGFCRAGGATDTCASVRGDANLGGDVGLQEHCVGTPTACETIIPMSDCVAHAGCSFGASFCQRTVNCAGIGTNTECENTPGCQTDIPTSTCQDIGGYCHGLTKSACESLHGTECAFTGGCTGTPRACIAFSPADCFMQDGCEPRTD